MSAYPCVLIIYGRKQLMPFFSKSTLSTRLYSYIPAQNQDEKYHFRVADDLSQAQSSSKLQAPNTLTVEPALDEENYRHQSGKTLLFWSTQRQLYSLFDHSGEKSSAIPAVM
ncbi:uncharacterized protein FTOL_04018 [Fusarium torulosum]|uniref:Uncharacterized protein n=1 Tax=Fusarium torulosum TaxID=33205 RepID=A0AAE8M656_9HYPO|nr:uncharacterized protein FTOL_04018 [Fusarium torulosum]